VSVPAQHEEPSRRGAPANWRQRSRALARTFQARANAANWIAAESSARSAGPDAGITSIIMSRRLRFSSSARRRPRSSECCRRRSKPTGHLSWRPIGRACGHRRPTPFGAAATRAGPATCVDTDVERRLRRALASTEEVLKSDGRDVRAARVMAESFTAQHQPQEALDRLTEIAGAHPESARPQNHRAVKRNCAEQPQFGTDIEQPEALGFAQKGRSKSRR